MDLYNLDLKLWVFTLLHRELNSPICDFGYIYENSPYTRAVMSCLRWFELLFFVLFGTKMKGERRGIGDMSALLQKQWCEHTN